MKNIYINVDTALETLYKLMNLTFPVFHVAIM